MKSADWKWFIYGICFLFSLEVRNIWGFLCNLTYGFWVFDVIILNRSNLKRNKGIHHRLQFSPATAFISIFQSNFSFLFLWSCKSYQLYFYQSFSALKNFGCARAHPQFSQDLALALKTNMLSAFPILRSF